MLDILRFFSTEIWFIVRLFEHDSQLTRPTRQGRVQSMHKALESPMETKHRFDNFVQ